jgi:immune inhibitor A
MKSKFFMIMAFLLISRIAAAVSLSPESLEELRANGQLKQVVQVIDAAREKGVWEPNPEPYRPGVTTDVDTLHCLVILVDFDDNPYDARRVSEPEEFDTLLFSEGITDPGSMTDFYLENSYGQAFLAGQVTDWYRMPQDYAYYVDGRNGFGDYPRNAQRLTEDAVMAADPDVDFSMYDNDGDGMVDALFVVHAGPGAEDSGGNPDFIWSHAWVTSYYVPLDSVYVYRYSMEPEETNGGQLIRIGVFCHELGHVLGLPDLYDTDYSSSGMGYWSVMAGGSWGGGGARPVHFDAWCKYAMGWVNPTVVEDPLDAEQIDAVEFEPDVYQLYSLGIPNYEYFLVENRRRQLFDYSMPGEGLLIIHVDETVQDNRNENHYKVIVEQADGQLDLEGGRGADAGDPYPGNTDNRTFDDFSTPNAWLYNGQPSEISVIDISDSDSTMFADLSVEYNIPLYELLDLSFDETSGNDNQRPEPGETLDLLFSAQNIRFFVDDLSVIGRCSDSRIIFTDSVSWIGETPVDVPFDNQGDPIAFSVPEDFPISFVEFTLRFTALDGEYNQEFGQRVLVGVPDLLLVDDDGGLDESDYFTSALENLEQVYDIWDVSTEGSPASVLGDYLMVIWFTGDTRGAAMPSEDVEALTTYLDGNGRFFMTSQDFVQRLSERGDPADLALIEDYLKVGYETRETDAMVFGDAGTVFEGLQFLTAGTGGAGNQVSRDALIMHDGGMQMLSYGSGRIAGVAAVNGYAALTIGFGIEGIYNDYPGGDWDNREDILDATMNFLWQATSVSESEDIIPVRFSLSQNYPNPFNPSTTIAFDLPAPGPVRLTVYDLLGRMVDTPVNSILDAGRHKINWDGKNRPSGVYFYRLITSDETVTRRMTLLK